MSDSVTGSWDEEFDVVVIGSGAGAMAAGVVAHDRKARVLLVEKSDRYGGSSAMSGGSLWVPQSHFMDEAGIEDNREDALAYLKEITAGAVDGEKLEAYVDTAPEAVRYLADHAHLKMYSMPAYSDYYPRAKGSKPGGRSLDPETFDARSLGNDLLSMKDQNPQMLVMGRLFMTIPESRTMLTRAPGLDRSHDAVGRSLCPGSSLAIQVETRSFSHHGKLLGGNASSGHARSRNSPLA